jgi:hypothetical protein
MKGPAWTRLAAATGVGFVALIAAGAIVMESKDINFAGDVAQASNEVFGTVTLFIGVATALFLWFTGTLAARCRQLEGGSGRLAAVVNGSGAAISGGLALSVAGIFAARNGGAPDLAAFSSGILDGPTLLFPAAAYVGAAGIVGMRAEGLPTYSRWLALLSVPLGAAFVAMAGLQIFKYYAWINDTAYISFIAWVLILSIIGIMRWTDMDERAIGIAPVAPARPTPPAPVVESDEEPIVVTRTRKPAARKKPATRKTPARKS